MPSPTTQLFLTSSIVPFGAEPSTATKKKTCLGIEAYRTQSTTRRSSTSSSSSSDLNHRLSYHAEIVRLPSPSSIGPRWSAMLKSPRLICVPNMSKLAARKPNVSVQHPVQRVKHLISRISQREHWGSRECLAHGDGGHRVGVNKRACRTVRIRLGPGRVFGSI